MPFPEITQVSYTADSFGITLTSLRNLRDWIADHRDQEMAIVQVHTEEMCCGYVCILKDGSAFFTGDGFRTDGGGEGGAGYRTAEALFLLWGLQYDVVFDYNFDFLPSVYTLHDHIHSAVKTKMLSQLNEYIDWELTFKKPGDPQYLRPALY
jgi:hypothetical protein